MWVLYLEREHSKAEIAIIPARTLAFFMASPGLLRRQASVPQRLDSPMVELCSGQRCSPRVKGRRNATTERRSPAFLPQEKE